MFRSTRPETYVLRRLSHPFRNIHCQAPTPKHGLSQHKKVKLSICLFENLNRLLGEINLPGWCWAEIQQLALVGSSSSLHSEACNALGASDGVIHSSISHEVDGLRASANIDVTCDWTRHERTGRPRHGPDNMKVQVPQQSTAC